MLGQLAAGANIDELLADYPYLERQDVLAALEYAAAAAQELELAVAARIFVGRSKTAAGLREIKLGAIDVEIAISYGTLRNNRKSP